MKRLLILLLPVLLLLGGWAGQNPAKRSIESISASTGAAMSSYPTASSVVDGDKALISKSTASNATQQAAMSTVKSYVLQPGTLTYTANASPSAAELLVNKYISNYGSTGTIAVTLPGVPYEISRAIVIESAQIVQVTPPSGEAFDLSGTTLTVNQSFAGPATVGSKIVITRQRNAAGSWIWSADVVRGTWAGI